MASKAKSAAERRQQNAGKLEAVADRLRAAMAALPPLLRDVEEVLDAAREAEQRRAAAAGDDLPEWAKKNGDDGDG